MIAGIPGYVLLAALLFVIVIVGKLRERALGPDVPPVGEFKDDLLGTLVWSNNEEGWTGSYANYKFLLAYSRASHPAPDLIHYARSCFADASWLPRHLEVARADAVREYGDQYAEEIAGLTYGTLSFFDRRTKHAMLADLDGGRDYRSWRIEFEENTCHGIGFDT